ncbi:hypothetical protein M011DRAFT_266555 [Sporormia fimetaria CBS 119925]|uniref:Uncharacterized protein n=1 Tax=Sporormia fimetaria CBS 119925 TaxID=1340428 RepID=A0A6A6UY59_9PLEO|nr:hypothetical protein M011DRAFT_266555 [Sporormia fimetaria CBS 119925]
MLKFVRICGDPCQGPGAPALATGGDREPKQRKQRILHFRPRAPLVHANARLSLAPISLIATFPPSLRVFYLLSIPATMRVTRAAMRAGADADAKPTPTDIERIPLSAVSSNPLRESADSEHVEIETKPMPPKRTKSKGGGRKGTRGKRGKAAEQEHEEHEEHADPVVLEDVRRAAGSPASDAASDDLINVPIDASGQIPMSDERPASPSSRAVRMTRRQLAKHEEDASGHPEAPAPSEVEEPAPEQEEIQTQQEPEAQLEAETVGPAQPVDAEAAPEPTESAKHVEELTPDQPREDAPGTSTQVTTPARNPSGSPPRSPLRLEESIGAMDALEEAVENVIQSSSPTSSRSKQQKAAPVTERASSSKPTRKSSVAGSARPSMARASSVRARPNRESRMPGEVTDYLASKRRPISISFPTPPPPPKAAKRPTVSNFQLPGEAVAAKLKAQKEERLRREQEGGQRPQSATLSRAPTVRSSKPPTKSTFQLPGEAVAAKLKAQREERLKREAEGTTSRRTSVVLPTRAVKSTKPPTVPKFSLPGESVAAKLKAQREERLKREEEEAAKKATFKARPAPTHKAAPAVRQTAASKARVSIMAGGVENQGSTIPPKRMSTMPSSAPITSAKPSKPVAAPVDAAALKQKGREVFNRDKIQREEQDKERREKEEAAKRARAEAAERGRIASREWAERQKKKTAAVSAAKVSA